MSNNPTRAVPQQTPSRSPTTSKATPSPRMLPKKPPASGYASATPNKTGFTALVVRVVGQFFAPIEKHWDDAKVAAGELVGTIEKHVLDPIVAGATAVYEAITAEPSTVPTPAARSAAVVPLTPDDAIVVGALTVDHGSIAIGSSTDAAPKPNALAQLLPFLCQWGTPLDPSASSTAGTRAGAFPSAQSRGRTGASIVLPAGVSMAPGLFSLSPLPATLGAGEWGRAASDFAAAPGGAVSHSGLLCVQGTMPMWSIDPPIASRAAPGEFHVGAKEKTPPRVFPAHSIGEVSPAVSWTDLMTVGQPAGGVSSPDEASVVRTGDMQALPFANGSDALTAVAPRTGHPRSGASRWAGEEGSHAFPALPLPIFPTPATTRPASDWGTRHADRVAAAIAGERPQHEGSGQRHPQGQEAPPEYPEDEATDPEIVEVGIG